MADGLRGVTLNTLTQFEQEAQQWGIPLDVRFALQEHIREQLSVAGLSEVPSGKWPSESEAETFFRDKVAEVLQANGLTQKALRYRTCSRFGYVVECKGEDRHRFYTVEHCDLRFCARCGPRMFKRFYAKYAGVLDYVKRNPRRGYRLRQITLTTRNTGELDSVRIKSFNQQVKKTIKSLMKGADSWGALWVNEVGFNNTNLHAHLLVYCPYVPQERLSSIWEEVSGHPVVWVNQAQVPGSLSLLYLLKYVSKPPSDDPRTIAGLEVAFHGTRRVHALGLFYNFSGHDSDREDSTWRSCPKCGAELQCNSKVHSLGELLSMRLEFIGDCRKEGEKRVWTN